VLLAAEILNLYSSLHVISRLFVRCEFRFKNEHIDVEARKVDFETISCLT
jgi:hypothetical protein